MRKQSAGAQSGGVGLRDAQRAAGGALRHAGRAGRRDPARRAAARTRVRGGLLTQASVLKVTANGTTTSPVLRGRLDHGAHPGRDRSAAAARVPAVEPDTRGATTIREQLEQASHPGDLQLPATRRSIRRASRWRVSTSSAAGATATARWATARTVAGYRQERPAFRVPSGAAGGCLRRSAGRPAVSATCAN